MVGREIHQNKRRTLRGVLFTTARDYLSGTLADSISRLFSLSPATSDEFIFLQRTSKSSFGDLCTPAPLRLSSSLNCSPSAIADQICSSLLLDNNYIDSEVHHREGFLNFCVSRSYMLSVLSRFSEFSTDSAETNPGEDRVTQNCAAVLKHAAVRGIVPDKSLLRTYTPHKNEQRILRLVALCHDDLLSGDPVTFKSNSHRLTLEAYYDFYRKHPIMTDDAQVTNFRLTLTSAVWHLNGFCK